MVGIYDVVGPFIPPPISPTLYAGQQGKQGDPGPPGGPGHTGPPGPAGGAYRIIVQG